MLSESFCLALGVNILGDESLKALKFDIGFLGAPD